MAKLHDKGIRRSDESASAEALLATLQRFLASCRSPAALEYGDELIPLRPGEHTLEIRSAGVWIHAWDEKRSLSRRILSVERHQTGSLDCTIGRFGGATGKLSLLDLDRPQTSHRTLAGSRESFAAQFRRILFRQFPGWEITAFSSRMDLRRSFSPVFPRACLQKGNQQIAAMACPVAAREPALLAFALLWFDHLAAFGRLRNIKTRLCLFFPEGAGTLSAHRLHWLSRSDLNLRMFRFNAHGSAGEVDPHDLGNLDTRVSRRYVPPDFSTEVNALIERLAARSEIGLCPELDGALSVRLRGRQVARLAQNRVLLGMESKLEIVSADFAKVERFIDQFGALSIPGTVASRVAAPFHNAAESWLEAKVRANLSAIDASLLASPVHGQVLTFAAADRDLIDLLAVDATGRLTIIELKTTEDLQLPVQALDYWMRVVWHLQRGELNHLFPGIALSTKLPRLLLLAPAISFHSTNATVLRYFSRSIDVERVGINSDWQRDLKVTLRLKGAELPQSHGSFNECSRSDPHQKGYFESES